ncbi:MAG: hypothetical protein ACTSVZ_07335 [Promethearchaeota archaeon]
MEKNITRFVSHEYRNPEFEQMLKLISAKGGISVELTRQFTTKALEKWQRDHKSDVLALFTAKPQTRHKEINSMLEYFRDSLRPVIFSKKRLDIAMEIAGNSLENMFHLM